MTDEQDEDPLTATDFLIVMVCLIVVVIGVGLGLATVIVGTR